MFGVYVIGSLLPEQIPQAFPVVKAINPQITLEGWSNYAALFMDPPSTREPSEIITVQCPNGYIHGLACCRARSDLQLGRVLAVENFVGLDLAGGRRAAGALLHAMEEHARDWNCICVRLSLPNVLSHTVESRPDHSIFKLLRNEGYRKEPTGLTKRLAVPA